MTKGHSTTFEYGAGSDYATESSWTEFALIMGVNAPEMQSDDIETSHMQTTNQVKTFTAGWADAGEFQLEMQFLNSQYQTTLETLFREDRCFRITLVEGDVLRFNGYVKTIGMPIDREGLVTHNISIKVSGMPDFNAST